MKTLVLQGCLVVLLVLGSITGASAGTIYLRHDTAESVTVSHDPAELTPPGLSPSATDMIRHRPGEWKARMLSSLAAGLFSDHSSDVTDQGYSLDSRTLCVSNRLRMYPVVPGPGRSLMCSILVPARDSTPPDTFPGTMFLAGICLIGLSSLRKRPDNPAIGRAKVSFPRKRGASFNGLALNERLGSRA